VKGLLDENGGDDGLLAGPFVKKFEGKHSSLHLQNNTYTTFGLNGKKK